MKDTMRIEILEDGTISVKTGGFSAEIHQSADDFLDSLEELTGGDRQVEHKRHVHRHDHSQQQQAKA